MVLKLNATENESPREISQESKRSAEKMIDSVVVAGTSALLNLCRVGQDRLLAAIFREVHIPTSVRNEFTRLTATRPRFQGVAQPEWILVDVVTAIPPQIAACASLHAGERDTLALALQLHADGVLLDDAAGREAARQPGLPFMGIAGILLRAKQRRLIPAVAPVLSRLRAEAAFYVSPDFAAYVLQLAGEQPQR